MNAARLLANTNRAPLSGSSASRSRTARASASNDRRMSWRSVQTKIRTDVGITGERRARRAAGEALPHRSRT
ncbi:MAG: hypothetical protein ACRENE_34770, partial [Polyangiaceae bacterium]